MLNKMILAAAAMMTATFAGAIPCTVSNVEPGKYGTYCVSINGTETWGEVNTKTGSLPGIDNYNVDPFFTFTYGANTNGVHNVIFNMPFIGGPYAQIALSASGSLSPGGSPLTVKNISVTSTLNGAATAQKINLADTSVVNPASGIVPDVNDLANILTPASGLYGVILNFEHVGAGTVTFNGRIEILNMVVPEPATFALMGAALLGLGVVARRRA
jgi:hypothetical protein